MHSEMLPVNSENMEQATPMRVNGNILIKDETFTNRLTVKDRIAISRSRKDNRPGGRKGVFQYFNEGAVDYDDVNYLMSSQNIVIE